MAPMDGLPPLPDPVPRGARAGEPSRTQPGQTDKSIERIRWRARRGMLELDIVLGRFLERHYAELDAAARAAFDMLLEMPDAELWDMITGKAAPRPECGALLIMLQAV